MTLLEELAEDIEVHLPAPPSVEKLELPDCVVVDETGFPWAPAGGVHRIRFDASNVEERVPELRAMFRERGRDEFTWWVGTSSTPDDLEDRLLGHGASPYSDDPVIAAMISTSEPPEVAGFHVRRVERVEDFSIARELAWSTADSGDEQLARQEKQGGHQQCGNPAGRGDLPHALDLKTRGDAVARDNQAAAPNSQVDAVPVLVTGVMQRHGKSPGLARTFPPARWGWG